MISAQQKTFFETFGYLSLAGALAADVGWIIEDFEAAWRAHGDHGHDGKARTIYPMSMIAASKRLTALLDHPVIVDACDSLLGKGWAFYGGDGNLYSGDTGWHSDCSDAMWQPKSVTRHMKIAFYLDPLTRATGALRVIPGSHHHGDRYSAQLTKGLNTPDGGLDLAGPDVPSVALETTPGDLALFDHRTKHASFGGTGRRRMFTMNVFAPCVGAEGREAALSILRHYRDNEKVNWAARENWLDWYDSMTPGERSHVAPTVELGAEVVNEVALATR